MLDAIFWDVHSGLAREGPGDEESSARALAMMSDLLVAPRILDIGCGPGAQTLQLTRLAGATITAIDTHRPFLDALERSAAEAGFGDRITAMKVSMTDMPFATGSFDVIWSEGAAYMMGFARALAAWRRFLRPGGYIAVTEPCWLTPEAELPQDVREGWTEYPGMSSVETIRRRVLDGGYAEVGCFVLPPSSWWNYYGPMEQRVRRLREAHQDDPHYLSGLERHQAEIDLYRRYGAYYGYLFVVMQRPMGRD